MASSSAQNIPATGTLSLAWDGTGAMPTAPGDGRVVWLVISGLATVGVQVTGDLVGDLVPEVTVGRTAPQWIAARGEDATTGLPVDDITMPGAYRFDSAGYATFRLRCAAVTYGSAAVVLLGSVARSNMNGPVVAALNLINTNLELLMSFQPTFAKNPPVAKIAAYAAVPADSIVECNTSSGTFAVTLPNSGAVNNLIDVNWAAGTVPPTVAFASGASLNPSQAGEAVFQFVGSTLTFEYDGAAVYTLK